MLDLYKSDQNVVYNILKNSVIKDKVSHAYLFEVNGYKNADDMINFFIKLLFCPYKYTENSLCGDCTQCANIDKNCFPELKIISPDGLWIKKEQLDDLQKEFSMKGVANSRRIYVIKQADKLNPSSANTILKFLEEPSPNIVAILICDNIYQVLETIRSRCQIVSFKKNKHGHLINTIISINSYLNIPIDYNDDILKEKVYNTVSFINFLEKTKIETMVSTQKLWHDNFSGRDENIFAFDLMILFYKDCVNFLLNKSLDVYVDYNDSIKNVAGVNNLQSLNVKLKILYNLKYNLKYNANVNLIIDRLIIEFNGGV